MQIYAPNYYREFRCIAERCRHTCCVGWEIDIDEEALPGFLADPWIAEHISAAETPHILLEEGERCPFLRGDGLCEMILRKGEGSLCQICRDHPRFRNFWTGRTEIGLGLVCEEAARLILSRPEPMRLQLLEADGEATPLPPDEEWLLSLRDKLISEVGESGPRARLKEYLLFRHLPDALYDGMAEERIRFVDEAFGEICALWDKTDGTLDSLVEAVRSWSYDVEYDDEVIAARLKQLSASHGDDE